MLATAGALCPNPLGRRIESLLQLKLEARIEAVKTVYYQLQQVYGISAVERTLSPRLPEAPHGSLGTRERET